MTTGKKKDIDFRQALITALAELSELVEERKQILARLNEIDSRMGAVRYGARALAKLLGEDIANNPLLNLDKNAGLTSAIRAVLSTANGGINGPEIRRQLREWNFDVDSYTNPLATIHLTCKRLVKQGEAYQPKPRLYALKRS